MSSDIKMKISISSDDEGYVLLKCPTCREFFMLTVEDIENKS